MKKLLSILLLSALISILVACGGSDKDNSSEAASEGEFEWPKSWIGSTQGTGSSSHSQMLAWGNKLEEESDMKIRIVPENSNPVKVKGVENGQFNSHLISQGEIIYAMEGLFGYESKDGGPAPLAGMWSDSAQPFGIMVRGDSDIKEVSDIKAGDKIVHFTIPGGLDIIDAVLAWADVSVDDVTLVETGDYAAQAEMVADGKADVAVLLTPAAPAVTEASAAPHGIRFLDLDPEKNPEAAERFMEVMPAQFFLELIGVPEGNDEVYGWGTSTWYWVHEDEDPDVVYNMVKWLNESYDDLKGLHPSFEPNLSLEANMDVIDKTYLPLHEGTIRYLDEIGEWTEEHERRQEYNQNLVHQYIEEYENAINAAESEDIKIDAGDAEWVEFWTNYKIEKDIPQFAVMTDEEIEEALK